MLKEKESNKALQSGTDDAAAEEAALIVGGGAADCGGVVKVHESVLASIVRKATCSVEGVTRLSGSSFVDNIAEIVGSRKMLDRSIVVEMGETSVQVEVRIVAVYGAYLPSVAMQVQEAIIGEVTRITGMHVGRVNVLVMDLDDVSQQENA